MARNVILSPHFDDAVLNCWHIFIKKNTTVVNIFSGIPPRGTSTLWDRICGQSDSQLMMQQRKAENANAATIAGNKSSQLFLNLLDNQYRPKSDSPSVNKLTTSFEKMVSGSVKYYAPLAISRVYRHPDHILIRKVGLELKRRGHEVYFYPDHPYMSSPKTAKELSLNRTKKLAEKVLKLPLSIEVNSLDKSQIEKRYLALRAYKSQYTAINIQTFGAISRLSRCNYELVLKAI